MSFCDFLINAQDNKNPINVPKRLRIRSSISGLRPITNCIISIKVENPIELNTIFQKFLIPLNHKCRKTPIGMNRIMFPARLILETTFASADAENKSLIYVSILLNGIKFMVDLVSALK